MKNIIKTLQAHRRWVYGIVIAFCILNGLTIALLTYNQSFGMGDDSTFFDFANNLSHGEAIYKDFIHFRTPGDYFLATAFDKTFGDKMSSLELSLNIETLVLFPTLLLIGAILIQREKKNPIFLLATFACVAFLPGIADLRVGLGIVATALYYTSFQLRKHQKLFLFLTGIFLGLTFTFGQEIAAMIVVLLVVGELFNDNFKKEWKSRLKLLAAGTLLGLLPLLVYVVAFSNISNFLYYTIWYSFIIQPKFMNLPFPGLSFNNAVFYLPFVIYWFCFLVLYANRKLGKPAALILSFCILQLLTALGRSDFDHLLFAIPEMFIVVPLYLVSIKDAQFSKKTLKSFLPYGLMLIVLSSLAKVSHSMTILVIPFMILYALDRRQKEKEPASRSLQTQLSVAMLFGFVFLLFIFLLYPTYKGTYDSAVAGWHNRHNTTDEIEGVMADPVTYKEVTGVEAQVKKDHPNTIFSFPIIAFFDTLAPHHGSRFITFEFETTLTQQKEAISDLERTTPGVVVFDPLQAEALSTSAWNISEYIMAHYQVQKQISDADIYWVMIPKAHPARDEKLVYELYHYNATKTDQTALSGIQSSAQNINYAIAQQSGTPMKFTTSSSHVSYLSFALLNSVGLSTGTPVCGNVTINYGKSSNQTKSVCSNDDEVVIPIKATKEPINLSFTNHSGTPIIWNNLEITN